MTCQMLCINFVPMLIASQFSIMQSWTNFLETSGAASALKSVEASVKSTLNHPAPPDEGKADEHVDASSSSQPKATQRASEVMSSFFSKSKELVSNVKAQVETNTGADLKKVGEGIGSLPVKGSVTTPPPTQSPKKTPPAPSTTGCKNQGGRDTKP